MDVGQGFFGASVARPPLSEDVYSQVSTYGSIFSGTHNPSQFSSALFCFFSVNMQMLICVFNQSYVHSWVKNYKDIFPV